MGASHALDIRTLLFVASLVSAVTSASLTLAWRVTPRHRSLAQWSIGFTLGAFGFILIWFRGILPDLISIPVANTFTLAGFLVFLHGINTFLDLPRPVWPSVALVAVTFALLSYYTYVEPSLQHRIIVVSVPIGSIGFIGAWRLTAHPSRELKFTQTIVANLLAIHGVVMTGRVIATIQAAPGEDLFVPNLATLATCLDFLLFFPCIGFGLLTMVYRKANVALESEVRLRQQSESNLVSASQNLEKVIEEMKTLKGVIPICSSCKKIRDEEGTWNQLEAYISTHSYAEFSHGVCPECRITLYPDL